MYCSHISMVYFLCVIFWTLWNTTLLHCCSRLSVMFHLFLIFILSIDFSHDVVVFGCPSHKETIPESTTIESSTCNISQDKGITWIITKIWKKLIPDILTPETDSTPKITIETTLRWPLAQNWRILRPVLEISPNWKDTAHVLFTVFL